MDEWVDGWVGEWVGGEWVSCQRVECDFPSVG